MPQAARLADPIGHTKPGDGPKSGGGGDVTGKIIGPCSGNVFTNGIKAARASVDETVCSKHDSAPPPIASGSPTVFINGLPAARVSDKICCGAFITDGSPNVFIGGGAVQTDPIKPESLGAIEMGQALLARATAATLAFAGSADAVSDLLNHNHIGCADALGAPSNLAKGEASYITGAKQAVLGNFDRMRKDVTIGEPSIQLLTFEGTTDEREVLVYPIKIGTNTVELVVQKDPATYAPGQGISSIEAIADGLSVLGPGQLELINEVVLSPVPNPDDGYFKIKYKNPNFQAAAAAGHGTITYYPQPIGNISDQEIVDSMVIHESGHLLHGKLWENPAAKKAWKKAIAKDGRRPSKYAASHATEDFSESLVMYGISKGTPQEARARQLFPARYKILDDIFVPPKKK
ncbi:PAAR domain-containing protein [Massilia violaceinigra]|uniref:PAAR domain-containing protein n=1 Tax=Massilia violaceinigra TaxID=2045208 RepID=A0ABY4A3P3_9BURK|nr:PAAR domain-containing protein [Massilia violaceinigra]UOD29389.1 PAAR domain-containing protein [Massilia violaceinigra]